MDIQSVESLLEYASKVALKEVDFSPVNITAQRLVVPIEIDGIGWEKRMDIRHAAYIISLQDALDHLIDELLPDIRETERPFVRAELLEGSSKMDLDINGFAKLLVNGMTDKQKFMTAVIAIAAATGYFGYSRYVDARIEAQKADAQVQMLAEHEETKRQMLAPLRAISENEPEKFAQYERPVAKIASMLEPGDQIALVGEGYITAEDAKSTIKPKRTRTGATVTPCDGKYLLMKTDFSMGEYILYLEQNGVPLKAYTSVLDSDKMRELSEAIATRSQEEDLPFTLDLQINVEHTGKRIKHGAIIGIGEPREERNHKRLSQLPGAG